FAIGFGMEMITPYTLYIGYLLLLPFVVIKSARPALPAAIIGNLICKVTFLPVALIPVAWKLERITFPPAHHHLSHWRDWLAHYQRIFLLLTIFGAVLGVLSYFVVYLMIVTYQKRRLAKRKLKRQTQIS
ncbi:MAG: hypothetical protein JWN30_1324, partial [Bacilli bacterium]|nr:hypothetical protein [Bacilli bacterium]